MKLIFIRHGPSEGSYTLNQEKDFERELTSDGKKKVNKLFFMFKNLMTNVDVIFTSPLARAVQTAEIFWSYYQHADLELMSDLDILDDPGHLVEYISFLPSEGVYAFVGHNPHITQVIAALLMLHPEHEFLELKKGGICILEGGLWQGFKMELLLSPKSMKILGEKKS